MLFEFEPFQVDIDVERTQRFYEKAQSVQEGCSCDGCRNFVYAVDSLPETVKTFLAKLGVDIRKICECCVNCTNTDGTLLYGGFFHVCGSLKKGLSAWEKDEENIAYWNGKRAFFVSPDFQVSFREDTALLEDDFPMPALQVDILANIPWVLHERNPYKSITYEEV